MPALCPAQRCPGVCPPLWWEPAASSQGPSSVPGPLSPVCGMCQLLQGPKPALSLGFGVVQACDVHASLLLQPRHFSTMSTCSTAPSRSSARETPARPWPCATRELRLAVAGPGDSGGLWGHGPVAGPRTHGVILIVSDGMGLSAVSPVPMGAMAWQRNRTEPSEGRGTGCVAPSGHRALGVGQRLTSRILGAGMFPQDTPVSFLSQQSPGKLQEPPCLSCCPPSKVSSSELLL